MINKLIVAVVAVIGLVGCANQGKGTHSSRGLKRVHFDYDQSLIRSDMVPVMDANVAYLKNKSKNYSKKSNKNLVTVEGHCDERGTVEYNYALGARRAETAKSYLVSHGFDASRIKTVSMGEDKSLCNDADESCWSMNRRDEFLRK